jgi:arabinofuranan 3-O-arabinosyltransferase
MIVDVQTASRSLLTPPEPRLRRRIPPAAGLLAGCLLLVLLAFVTSPGDIIADSKLDLPVNPAGFLARALSLWDPQQFGQLQNQANGYLFPMGPFFLLGKLATVPPWIVQRLWISAVLIAAFLGTARLAGRLGIGTPWTRPVAGLAYALSPMALTLLGEYSGEWLPQAILPWILVPLTDTDPASGRVRRPGRAAARSAVAVALCSGINAACTAAVLVPVAIYILTRPRTARWRLLGWWAPAVVLATVWWSVPLGLLLKYGVSFLPYTESAAATTSVTGLDHALRGTEIWISYLVVNGDPWWLVGYRIANQVLPTLLSGLVTALGLAGLARRQMPERRFLLWSVLAGLVIIGSGYVSSLGNPLAGPVDAVINGPASAFRNLWKFDPLIRLPVALGLAQLLATVRLPRARAAVAAAALAGVGGLALPAYLSGLATIGSFPQIPSYWAAAANWLNAHAGHSNVLVEPGAVFGQYTWGSPLDDVIEPLTTADWGERNLNFIGSAGNERLLDAVDQQLADGVGSAGLTQVLARMGIRYVVVRNDIERSILLGAWPARIHQALAESPGLTRVASFGPLAGSIAPDDAVTDFDTAYPSVEIYQVAGAEPPAAVLPAAGTLRVYGAPEAMITLAEEDLLGDRPMLLDNDGPGLPASGTVATDSLRRKTRDFGQLRTSYSPTLTATQPPDTFEVTDDFTEPGWNRYQAVAQYTGIKNVTASTSASDIATIPQLWASGLLPYAAVDGDLRTKWESGAWTGPIGQWIQLRFDRPVSPRTIKVTFVENSALGPPVSQVVVSTARGRLTERVRDTPKPQPLRVPAGASGWLRITVTGLAYPPTGPFGAEVAISDIAVPGVHASRTIVAPRVPGGDPSAVVLAKAQPQPSGCMLTSLRWVCSPSLLAPTEEQYGFDHSFTEPSTSGPVTLRGSAVLVDPALVARYAAPGRGRTTVSASSTYTDDLEDQPRSAFDGNPATSWIAGGQDLHPTLAIRWGYSRTISQVTIQRPPGASGLLQVLITGDHGQARGAMISAATSVVRFAPMRTNGLTFKFTLAQAPLQISDVQIPGVPSLVPPQVPFRLRCGLGPLIEFNGRTVPTSVSGTFADLLTGRPMEFSACSQVTPAAGVNHVVEPTSDAFSVQDVVLGGTGAAAPSAPAAAVIKSWSPSRRVLSVDAPTRSYLAVDENFNVGWRAVTGGRTLQAVRLDGWKQAWLLPAGTSGVVTLTYAPDRPYRIALFGGLVLLALIMLVAAWPSRWWRERRPRVPAGPPGPGRIQLPGLLMAAVLLPAAGFWLGGYPGAAIVPVATALFLPWDARPRRFWRGLSSPVTLAVLVLAAAVAAAAGHRMLLSGASGLVVAALNNALPQVIGLLVVGRLAAALLTWEVTMPAPAARWEPPDAGTPPHVGTPPHAGAPPHNGRPPGGRKLAAIGRAWETLAEGDPLWAICVAPEAKHGGWDVARFYATGAAEVDAVLSRASELGMRVRGERALDFGCGAGRLTRPLAARFDLVDGVDIAPGMLELARRDNPVASKCRFLLNSRPDLALFPDGEFDLVYTSVVLQHLSPALARTYLAEFARVLRPGGSLVFQLPTRPRLTPRGLLYRCLPAGLIGLLQRRLLGYPAPMRMHGMSERRVRALLARHGVEVLAAEPVRYHPDWHERRYYSKVTIRN